MTEKIREQILAVRKTGCTNMFDVPMVQYIANEMCGFTNWWYFSKNTEASMCISFSRENRCNIHSFRSK